MLRIIAGKHRGRNIATRPGKAVRPTGSLARGAIFNILMHGSFGPGGENPLIGQRVIDLFCGTGALGLEALSRGAEHVTFVDEAAVSIKLARENAEQFHESENVRFIRSDSTVLPAAREPCALAFLDPPYHSGLAVKALAALHKQGWLVEGAVVTVEMSLKETFVPAAPYAQFDEREYGNSKIVFLRYGGGN